MPDQSFSAFVEGASDAGALASSDLVPVVRGGVTYSTDISLIGGGGGGGLVAIARNTTGVLVNDSATTRINFDTKDYDPSTTITTGGSWKFEPAATAWYRIVISQAFINRNGFAWVAGGYARIDAYVNGSPVATVGYAALESVANNAFTLFPIGSKAFSLATTDDFDLRFANFTGAQRELESDVAIEIYKVT